MKLRTGFIASVVTGLALGASLLPAAAAEPTVVKVALLDASAVESTAGGPASGMMAPGTGFSGMGLMAPGVMARSGFGPGMMGLMSVRIDQNAIKAGPVTFEVTNWSRGIVHEMKVVPVDNANAPLPYDFGRQIVPEEQIKVLGGSDALEPNGSQTIEIALKPGVYLLMCNLPGHYAAGMVTALTVSP